MYDRLLAFMENHKLLFSGQFGFRRLHSSYMALMIIMDKLISSLDKGETDLGKTGIRYRGAITRNTVLSNDISADVSEAVYVKF